MDRTNKKCSECGKGKYKETSMMDDIDGVLHCTNCGSRVKRYSEDDEIAIKEGYLVCSCPDQLTTGFKAGTHDRCAKCGNIK